MGKGDVNIIKNSLPEDGFSIVGVSNVRKSYVLGGLEIHGQSDGISITNALISDHTILLADKLIRDLDSRIKVDIFLHLSPLE